MSTITSLIMSNEGLFIIQLILCFVCQLAAYKFFGTKGLFAWIVFAAIVCNIEATKAVNMFGVFAGLGNILYGSTFLATDILSEKYGGKVARRSILLSLCASVFFVIFMQISLAYTPNEYDFVNGPMHTLFKLLPRFLIASLVCFAISNTLDTYTYELFRKWFPKHLWIRNNGSTVTSQLVDSSLFCLIAFTGVYPSSELVSMALIAWAVKVGIALCDTPFIYLAKRIKPVHETEPEITAKTA